MGVVFRAVAVTALACQASAAAISIEPPPGWGSSPLPRDNPDVVAVLKGPETSSFTLARLKAVSMDNRAGVSAELLDVLAALKSRTGLNYQAAPGLETIKLQNGLTAFYLKAGLDGRPRLILALFHWQGESLLGTLTSSIPDLMLPSILGGLKSESAGMESYVPGSRVSAQDGQFSVKLPEGFFVRPASDQEMELGAVLAVKGTDTQMIIFKLGQQSEPPVRQPELLKQRVLSVAGVLESSLSAVQSFNTPCGQELIYLSAVMDGPTGAIPIVAGYLPWGYWGYSIIAQGPRAYDLLTSSFRSLALGEAAVAKIVAQTPRIPLSNKTERLWQALYVFCAALSLVAAGVWAWVLTRHEQAE